MKRFVKLDKKIFSENLNPYSISIYGSISIYVNANGECFPSRRTLAERGGFSIATYNKYIKIVIEKGFLRKSSRWRANGSQTSNLFKVSEIKNSAFFIPSDIFNKKLRACELAVYMYLCSRKTSKNKCFVSQREIANACGISRRQVGLIIRQLQKKKIITTRRQQNLYNNGNYILEYTICVSEDLEDLKDFDIDIILSKSIYVDMRDYIKCGKVKNLQ
ncbi:MAG: helix-turn-helix domain-containing protein [Clostridia bacterium]|nr:helix-turn-helix domain-containing protein [Clostridia bacterium]NDO18880.1 helix-turn-helix domain-containing protein [Lachnospiraceae bacterium MD329]